MSGISSDPQKPAERSSFASFFSGMLGGVLVGAVFTVVIATTGRLEFLTKTVTVEEAQIGSATASQQTRGLTAREIYERDAPGVVFVNATGVSVAQSSLEYLRGEDAQQATATGSGFEIDGDGTILTNWHVVEGAAKVTIGLDHGKTVEASLIGKDPSDDLAALRIPTNGRTLHPLILGESSNARVGDPVFAIGNPFALDRTLTTGVVSALHRNIQAPNGLTISNALQTDAPINPGNSGGPLLNEQGEVIGINSQIETGGYGGGSVGIAFAIPIDMAKGELSRLEKGGVL